MSAILAKRNPKTLFFNAKNVVLFTTVLFIGTITFWSLILILFTNRQHHVTKVTKTDISNLLAVVQIARHGQKVPTFWWPTDPYFNSTFWPGKSGEITKTGKNQMYYLGKFTRARYDGFIPEFYNGDDFFIESTDCDRTLISAQCLNAGIFKNVDIWNKDVRFEPIPVRITSNHLLSMFCPCKIYTSEVSNVLNNTKEFKMLYSKEKSLIDYVNRNTERSLNMNPLNLIGVYDTLQIEEQFGYELSKWTEKVYPNKLRDFATAQYYVFVYTDLQKKLVVGSWFKRMLENFNKISKNPNSTQKFHTYIAHDINIATILLTLGAFDFKTPAYASSILFELRNKDDVLIVNVWYKNGDELKQLKVAGCKFDCSLEDFEKILKPWLVNHTTWNELCSKDPMEITNL